MGRPKKEGLSWFKHDVNASSGHGVEVLESTFGISGYAFFFKCLERIYRHGGYWDVLASETRRIFGVKCMQWGVSDAKNSFDRYVSVAINAGLFDKNEWETSRILTSDDIKQRCGTLLKKRVLKPPVSDAKTPADGEYSEQKPQFPPKEVHISISRSISREYTDQEEIKNPTHEHQDAKLEAGDGIPDDPDFLNAESVSRDNRNITCGKRPLTKYPDIWLSRPELDETLETLKRAGVKDLRSVFLKVRDRLNQWKIEGKDIRKPNVKIWLTGFAMKEVLEEEKASADAMRAGVYLNNAAGSV